MSIISNFELLFKPLAPQGGPATEIARTVIQGYFLEISNLDSEDFLFHFRTRTSVKGPADSINTEFTTNNNSVVFDITSDNNSTQPLTSYGDTIPGDQRGHAVICLQLPAGKTASLAVLPNIPQIVQGGTFDLAIRGYTEIVSAADRPGKILVSPEHRGTFVDPDFDFTNNAIQTGLDFDQLAYGLPIANGQAVQDINTWARFSDPFIDLATTNMRTASFMDDQFRELIGNDLTESSRGSRLELNRISRKLSKEVNAPTRTTAFKIGSTPIKINYAIKEGIFIVEEKSLIQSLGKKLKTAEIDPESFAKQVNAALAGDQNANEQLSKWIRSLKL